MAGLAVALMSLVLAACRAEKAAAPTPGEQAVTIVGKDIAFAKGELKVKGGQRLAIRFDNQDSGIPHNFALYKTAEAKELIAKTEIEPGPVRQHLHIAALAPGRYSYRCDTHPTQMTGSLIVEGG